MWYSWGAILVKTMPLPCSKPSDSSIKFNTVKLWGYIKSVSAENTVPAWSRWRTLIMHHSYSPVGPKQMKKERKKDYKQLQFMNTVQWHSECRVCVAAAIYKTVLRLHTITVNLQCKINVYSLQLSQSSSSSSSSSNSGGGGGCGLQLWNKLKCW